MAIIIKGSQVEAISGVSQKFDTAMVYGEKYLFISTTNCWFNIGATGGSAVANTAGNIYLPAGVYVEIKAHDDTNDFLHVIQDSAGGYGCLFRIEGA